MNDPMWHALDKRRVALKAGDPKLLSKAGEIGILMRRLRKGREAEVKLMRQAEDDLELFLINTFKKSELRQVKTKAGTMALVEKDVPKITNWDEFIAHVVATKQYDLLYRRPGEKACQERWKNNENVPGVDKHHDARIRFGED